MTRFLNDSHMWPFMRCYAFVLGLYSKWRVKSDASKPVCAISLPSSLQTCLGAMLSGVIEMILPRLSRWDYSVFAHECLLLSNIVCIEAKKVGLTWSVTKLPMCLDPTSRSLISFCNCLGMKTQSYLLSSSGGSLLRGSLGSYRQARILIYC